MLNAFDRQETAAGYIAESLRKVAFLKTLDDESLGLLGYLFRQRICKSGEVVCAEGEKGSSFFILVQGRALVSTTGSFLNANVVQSTHISTLSSY